MWRFWFSFFSAFFLVHLLWTFPLQSPQGKSKNIRERHKTLRLAGRQLDLGSQRPATEPKTPKARKVSKVSRKEFGTPDPGPPKNQLFLTFRTFFRTFCGSGVGDPKLLSGDFFENLGGFGDLGSVDGRRDPKLRRAMHW